MSAQEDFNRIEREYEKIRIAYREALRKYRLQWAKEWDKLKAQALHNGNKLTQKDLEFKLLVKQSDPETELGASSLVLSAAESAKSLKRAEYKIAERRYWDDKSM